MVRAVSGRTSSCQRPILIVGSPRSGTTWIGRVLSADPATVYVHEPDNEKLDPLAFVGKATLHRFPCLSVERDHAPFERLWHVALSGAAVHGPIRRLARRMAILPSPHVERDVGVRCRMLPPEARPAVPFEVLNPRLGLLRDPAVHLLARAQDVLSRSVSTLARPVAKSVHSVLALDWITRRFPVTVVGVFRNPLNVVASCLRLNLPDSDRRFECHASLLRRDLRYRRILTVSGASSVAAERRVRRISRQLAVLMDALSRHLDANPTDTLRAHHERLCADPVGGFGSLYRQLGLKWSPAVETRIRSLDRPGRGFAPFRRTRHQTDKWKRELSTAHVDWVREEFAKMGRVADVVTS